MRALMLTILTLILIAFFVWYYRWVMTNEHVVGLNPELRLIGGIDMDKNEGVSVNGLRQGTDVLLVVNKTRMNNQFAPAHPEYNAFYNKPFDLANFNSNKDHIIDSEDPLWPFIYAVVYSRDGFSYLLRPLNQVGIRGILLRPPGSKTLNQAILSDGDMRTVYEFELHQLKTS
jgi:hypothetical protein